ncbi:MAG: hypothetical protein OXU64_02355 [Gemmatimonadota bacterium]|nr:hypothetical protein [Gemmatimonadota bacterium]
MALDVEGPLFPRSVVAQWRSQRVDRGPDNRGPGDRGHSGPGPGGRVAAELDDCGLGTSGDHGPGGPGSDEGGAGGYPTDGDGSASWSEPPMPAREPDSITPLEGRFSRIVALALVLAVPLAALGRGAVNTARADPTLHGRSLLALDHGLTALNASGDLDPSVRPLVLLGPRGQSPAGLPQVDRAAVLGADAVDRRVNVPVVTVVMRGEDCLMTVQPEGFQGLSRRGNHLLRGWVLLRRPRQREVQARVFELSAAGGNAGALFQDGRILHDPGHDAGREGRIIGREVLRVGPRHAL